MTHKPSICFVAPKAYGVLAERTDLPHGGGAAVQQVTIARELTRRGYEVTFICHDYGQGDTVTHNGIRVVGMCQPDAGLPLLRFIHPRWSSLWRALSRADAEVYYQRGAGYETGQVAMWCKRHARRFLFAIASDRNTSRPDGELATSRERILYRYGIRSAGLVLAQTAAQVRDVNAHFAARAITIPSCGDVAVRTASPPFLMEPSADGTRLLWVGRLHRVKRLELFLDLAERCREFTCDVVGVIPQNDDYSRMLYRRSESLPNVVMHGRVTREALERYYDRSVALVCTSQVEGFPNTFLEAWARGVPTVSTVDPDGVIAREGLGGIGTSPDELASCVRILTERPHFRCECSRRTQAYFRAHHTVDAVVDRFEYVLSRFR